MKLATKLLLLLLTLSGLSTTASAAEKHDAVHIRNQTNADITVYYMWKTPFIEVWRMQQIPRGETGTISVPDARHKSPDLYVRLQVSTKTRRYCEYLLARGTTTLGEENGAIYSFMQVNDTSRILKAMNSKAKLKLTNDQARIPPARK
jgi:hypothetical protein